MGVDAVVPVRLQDRRATLASVGASMRVEIVPRISSARRSAKGGGGTGAAASQASATGGGLLLSSEAQALSQDSSGSKWAIGAAKLLPTVLDFFPNRVGKLRGERCDERDQVELGAFVQARPRLLLDLVAAPRVA